MADAEDFEFAEGEPEAPPPRRAPEPERPAPSLSSRAVPHSTEAEEYLLGCCLLDGSATIAAALSGGITGDVFYAAQNRVIWEKMADLYRRKPPVDVAVLAEELKGAKQLDAAGGYANLGRLAAMMPTTAQSPYFVEKVRELYARRELIRLSAAAAENAYGAGDLAETISSAEARIASLARLARDHRSVEAKPILSFRYPRGERPDALIGNSNYLPRGGGMLFFSYAGVGKSSFTMGACMAWALAEPWFGLRVTNGKPLKSLIVQNEDFDDYVGMVAESFEKIKTLSPAQQAILNRNCVIVRLRGVAGEAFFSELRVLIAKHQPDLVAINPIYPYVAGSISDPRDSHAFLSGLDRLNADCRFAWILTHHTGKPQPRGTNGRRPEMDDIDAVYLGMGGSPFANWPRASMVIEPRVDAENRFWLKLGKGKNNAGLTREVDTEGSAGTRIEKVTKLGIRYSTQEIEVDGVKRAAIAWEVDDGPEAQEGSASSSDAPKKRPGRKSTWSPQHILVHVPTDEDGRLPSNQVFARVSRSNGVEAGMSRSRFFELLGEAIQDGIIHQHAADRKVWKAV